MVARGWLLGALPGPPWIHTCTCRPTAKYFELGLVWLRPSVIGVLLLEVLVQAVQTSPDVAVQRFLDCLFVN